MTRSVRLVLTISSVLVIMGGSGWLLAQQLDPRLEHVTFETVAVVTVPTESKAFDDDTSEVEPITIPVVASDRLAEKETSAVAETVEATAVVAFDIAAEATEQIETQPVAKESAVVISLLGPEIKQTCRVPVTETITVHQLMQHGSQQCGFSYSGEKYAGLGFYVKTIAGLKEKKTAGYYWVFSVNGAKSPLGVSSRTVMPGDIVQWNYEADY